MSDGVFALAVFDDGSGPALYPGGYFFFAGGVTVNRIARWDGNAWSGLSGGVSGVGAVYSLLVFDDGRGPALYAGGTFSAVGGVTVNNIARWDGSAWLALSSPSGVGVNGSVYALATFDDGFGPRLCAGGTMDNHTIRWDGSGWSALGGSSGMGVSASIRSLAVFDDGSGSALYAAGDFWFAGSQTVNHIARRDGTGWSTLTGPADTGVNGSVHALAVFDDGSGPALYAGGRFETAGGVTVNGIARWDGTSWSALGTGVTLGYRRGVYSLATFDDGSGTALYAGGWFETAGGVTVNNIARWDGTAWSALGTGISVYVNDAVVRALAVFDDGAGPALFAGGIFHDAGGVTAYHIARWDGTSWSDLAGGISWGIPEPPSVEALAVFHDGSGPALYVGGAFETAGGVAVNSIARWDGSAWSSLSGPSGTGVFGGVSAIEVFDDGSGSALYAGGGFETAGGVTVNSIARWDGSAWSAMSGPSATGVAGGVSALASYDDGPGPSLFAGGSFTAAGRLPSSNIAAWRCVLFADGFESGDTSAWTTAAP